ncbi:hypothetical protein X915_gp050 [Bacillus phage vB_BanS-Tsamsa]|uniref:Uncharacterized protein n=1 Tax=Bacillus phage vB_BanS-Tsamsa TaxID=1308863 RepID=U5JA06_9CAUD|nr:hypothetical protein X915_gp050 [Bacillus phage vB_BanS-Tsamsa]AGI11960.1 hypothetical protein [Bacillus phage vB_BanS-Tsamsa]
MKQFEIIFTETVKSRIVVRANSLEEADQMFDDGKVNFSEAEELDRWDAGIDESKELK